MSNNKKVITLGLDYSSFDGGITDVNRKMGLLDAQFKLSKEEIKEYGDETDQLTLKQEQLTQKINLQTQKVNLSKEAYDKAVEGGKASDKQLDNLQKAYITNQTTLQRLNNELSDNKEKIDKANKSTESFGDSIRGIASALGIEVSPAVETLATKFDGISSTAGTAVLAVGTLITTLASLTVSTAEVAGEIDELAHKTGLSTDTIQELNYAVEFLEISAEEIGSSIAKMTRNMDTARAGTGAAAEAFKALGVRVLDSNKQLRDNEEVFYDVIDALGKVGNETEKDAISMALFGRSAMSLNNLILEGSEGMKAYAEQAREAGYIMSGETIDAFNEFDDAMVEFNKKLDAVKMQLGESLLPLLTEFAELLSGIPTPVLIGVIAFGALSAVLISVATTMKTVSAANALLAASNLLIGTTGASATAGMLPLLLVLLAVAAAIALIVGGASAVKKSMDSVKDATTGVINETSATIEQAKSNVSSAGYHASGTKDFIGGRTWVGEGGPELVDLPKGSKIYNNRESKKMGGDTYYIDNITIDAKNVDEFTKVVKLAKEQKSARIRGEVSI